MTMRTTKPKLTKAQILSALKKNDELLKQYSVRRIGLFGSYARGQQTPTSDIDFIVEFERPTYDNFYGLCVSLEKLFKRKVEVLTPDAVDSIRVDEVARSIRESVIYV
jgi:predicted nucleotidyltransferase